MCSAPLVNNSILPSRIFPLLLLAVTFVAIANQLQDRKSILPTSIFQKSNDGTSTEMLTGMNASSERYLLYFTFDGFSNQIIGFQRAAQLALSVNRTLVLPPVLPHNCHQTPPPPFDAFPGRKGPSGSCRDQPQKYNLCVRGIYQDARAVLDRKPFPSLTNLINVDMIQKQVPGLRMIDFPQFISQVNQYESLKHEFWALNETLGKSGLDLDGRCTINETRPYSDLIRYFDSIFGTKSVAMIGSAYNVQNQFDNRTIGNRLLNFPLNPNVAALIKNIRYKLPSRYIGVHMRFKDDASFDCASNDTDIAAAFQNVASQVQQKQAKTILVGESHPQAAPCLQAALPSTINITTLSDIVGKYPEIEKQVGTIPLQHSTVNLLLDQLLVALADWVVLDKTAFYGFSSTFQALIQERHRHPSSMEILWPNESLKIP